MIQHFESGDRRYEWHPDKARSNLDKHGVDFVSVEDFEWDTAVIRPSDRHGETRFVAYGYVGSRIHVLAFTFRQDRIRVISLRKANDIEERYHAQAQT